MRIDARVHNSKGTREMVLQTDGDAHSSSIPPKPSGFGSSTSGGELLFLALAVCYCNDIYREVSQRGMDVVAVEASLGGDFGGAGEPARNVAYGATVTAKATEDEIKDLMIHTDRVAEIHNTLRIGTPVALKRVEAASA